MRPTMPLLLFSIFATCTGLSALPEEGLGKYWITEDHVAPGLTDQDRILHSFPIENAEGWTVGNGEVSVEEGDRFYGEACLRLSGEQNATIWREAEFAVNKLTFVTCAFLREVGCRAWFMARDAGGQWHEAVANSGLYWTHGYQHVTGRFTGFYFRPEFRPGDQITAIGFRVSGSGDCLVDDFHVVEVISANNMRDLLPRPEVAVPIANPIEIPHFSVQHPMLKYTPEQAAHLRAGYEKNPAVAAKSIAAAEAAIAEGKGKRYHLPVGDNSIGANYYTCDVHPETILKFDPQRPEYRWCEQCGKSIINERTTNAWIHKYSAWFFGQTVACANAYIYPGDDKYAAEVRRRALLFCQVMRDYPSVMFGGGMNNAHWYHLSIAENCLSAYDITYDSPGWSEEDRETLRNYLGRSYGPPQKPGSYTGNYISASAYTSLRNGLLFADRELVYEGINYYAGRTIQYLFDENGMWREKTWGYHNMVAHGMYSAANMAKKHLGIDIYHHSFGDKSLKRAYEIWVKGSFPDGSLPLINDNRSYSQGRGGGLNIQPWLKTVFDIYGDPIFDPDNRPILDSMDLQGPGWGYLRSDAEQTEDQVVAVLDYGSQRGAGHGHRDTMQLIVWANGETIAPDLDVAEYGRYPFYYAPGAHNTMSPLPAEGRTELFSDGPALKVISAATHEPAHLQQRRTVVLAADGSFITDFFAAASDRDEEYTWHWRCPGKFSSELRMAAYDGLNTEKPDYGIVENVRAAQNDQVWQAQWKTEKQTAILRMLGAPGTTVAAGEGYGYLPTQRMTMLAVQRDVGATLYASLFEFYRSEPRIKQALARDIGDDFGGWHVETSGGSYDLMAKNGAEDAVGSWRDGETDALLLATARGTDGMLRQLVSLHGTVLRSGGIHVTEGNFEKLEIAMGMDEVAVRYEGEGDLELVVPWGVRSLKSGPEGAQSSRGAQGTLLLLPESGYYELSL